MKSCFYVNNYKHGARAKFWLFLASLGYTESILNQQSVPKCEIK